MLIISYFYSMKTKPIKDKKEVRKQILESAMASFRIEGINIPKDVAEALLKKVELNLGR